MSRRYEKVDRIKKYYDNTIKDYQRLLIIDNFRGKDEDLDDRLLDELVSRLDNLWVRSKIPISLPDLAFALCENTLSTDDEIIELATMAQYD